MLVVLLPSLLVLLACGAPSGGEEGEAPQAPAAAEGGSSAGESGEEEAFWLGEPREDVERFLGVYGDPENPDRLHGQFFVAEAKRPKMAERAEEIPPGYLMIGAMWGDVAPWYMKSVSESTFQQVSRGDFGPPETIVVEFEFGSDGAAEALTFKSGMDRFDRRVRVGDLPQEWRE